MSKLPDGIEAFIRLEGKINWESEYEGGQYCIGETKLREFLAKFIVPEVAQRDGLIAALKGELSKLREERDHLANLLKSAISEPAASYISLAIVEQSIALLNKIKNV